MRIEKGGKLTNHTPIPNEIKRIFFAEDNDLDYGDFAVFIYIAMNVQYGEKGRDGKPNDKQGYCYKTKVAIRNELRIGKAKLSRHIERLKEHGFIETREVPNKFGGKPIEEYRLSERWKTRL